MQVFLMKKNRLVGLFIKAAKEDNNEISSYRSIHYVFHNIFTPIQRANSMIPF